MERRLDPAILFAAAAAAGFCVIAAALMFEHLGGHAPCPLCLEQRYAYYIGVPALAAAAASTRSGGPSAFHSVLLPAVLAVGFLRSAFLGGFQAGAEWGWWDGPASCAAAALSGLDAAALLEAINAARPASCTEASWRMFGLSFAGWNALASSGLAAASVAGSVMSWRRLRRM